MLYLMSCAVVMIAALYEALKAITHMSQASDVPSSPLHIGRAMLAILMCASFTAPFVATMLKAVGPEVPVIPNESIRWSVYFLAFGSLLVAGYGYLQLKQSPHAERGTFWAVGRALVLAGVVLVGAVSAYSHLTFFKSSKDGIANVEYMRGVLPLKDMANCTADVAFIQFREDGGPLKYRCPTLLMFGGFTSQPFAPWPDYAEGESQELADFIQETTQNARKSEPQ